MKNKINLTLIIILFLFGIITTSTITSSLIQKNIIIIEKGQIINLKDYGTVYGVVGILCFPPTLNIVGAKLVLEGDFNKKITFSGLLGEYKFNFVKVGRQYTLTVTHSKYETQSKTFTLLQEEPDKKINFYMEEKKVKDKTTIENNIIKNDGKIFDDIVTPYYSILARVSGINLAWRKK